MRPRYVQRRQARATEEDASSTASSESSSSSSSSASSSASGSSSSGSSAVRSLVQPSRGGTYTRSPTRRELSPGRSPAHTKLSRTQWTPALVQGLIERVSSETWPEGWSASERYRRGRLFDSFEWRVRLLRRDRFSHRRVDGSAIAAALAADDAQEGGGGGGADHAGHEAAEEDEEEEQEVGLLGTAADGTPSGRQRVLFVRAPTRAAEAVDEFGQRLAEATWFEVVPSTRTQAPACGLCSACTGSPRAS